MQFVKKTRSSRFVETLKLSIKLGLIILIVFVGVFLLNKIVERMFEGEFLFFLTPNKSCSLSNHS